MKEDLAKPERYFVSVIVTSYNYAPYVRQAIDSVLAQTFEGFQLIVVDDGSKDDSLDILNSYSDSRMRVISQENSGQATAWNRAYKHCTGDLIFFLDSDDWWIPTKLEKMVKMYEASGNAYAVLQHNLTVLRDRIEYPYRRILPSGDCFSDMKATGRISYFVTSSGLCLPRWVCEKIFPIPEELRISPDAYLTRTAFVYGSVLSVPDCLGYLRLHGQNAGMTQGQEFHDNLRRDKIFPALNSFYRTHSIDYEYKNAPPSTMLSRVRSKLVKMIAP